MKTTFLEAAVHVSGIVKVTHRLLGCGMDCGGLVFTAAFFLARALC